jgi:hypothetical protein
MDVNLDAEKRLFCSCRQLHLVPRKELSLSLLTLIKMARIHGLRARTVQSKHFPVTTTPTATAPNQFVIDNCSVLSGTVLTHPYKGSQETRTTCSGMLRNIDAKLPLSQTHALYCIDQVHAQQAGNSMADAKPLAPFNYFETFVW